jgi:hypothetical protein
MHRRRLFVRRAVFLVIAFGMVNANSMAGIAATASTPDATSQSCLDSAAPVLFLGTYHMDNPGRDMMNLQVDDVLAPKRQREIAELVDDLARFRPTKILIEAEYGNPEAQTKYFRIPTKRSNAIIRSTSSISCLSPREPTMREPTWWPHGTSAI